MNLVNINNNFINKKIFTYSQNINFGNGLKDIYNDEEYDENTIFAIRDRQDRINNIPSAKTQFWYAQQNIGSAPKEEPFMSLPINSLRSIGNNCYKGGLTDTSRHVEELKNSGMRKVIVLCNPDECNIIEECKKHNMPYTNMFVPFSLDTEIAKKDFNSKLNVGNFIRIVKDLREGNVFIGCESGNVRSKYFLQAVRLLDPESKLELGFSQPQMISYKMAKLIYKKMSNADKRELGYTSQFEDSLRKEFAEKLNI